MGISVYMLTFCASCLNHQRQEYRLLRTAGDPA